MLLLELDALRRQVDGRQLRARPARERLLGLAGARQNAGPQLLAPGVHTVEARFAVTDLSEVPLEVEVYEGGSVASDIAARWSRNGALQERNEALSSRRL